VRYEQDGPWITIECALELLDRRNVEMVRGLVEDETVHASGSDKSD